MKLNLSILTLVALLLLVVRCKQVEPYLDPAKSFEERTEDLVSRMTLEEKISQMQFEAVAIPRLHIQEYNWWNECLHGVGRSGLATVFPQAIGMTAMWETAAM